MVIFKFEKISTAALVSHVDNLRAVTYTLRRAGLDVEYSQGFNPHIELGFSSPIALGVESLAEYVAVKTDYFDGILEKVNAVCPNGLHFTKVFVANVNLAATLNRATYRVEAVGIGDVICDVLSDGYTISYTDKGQTVTKDVSSRIFSAKRLTSDSAIVTLAIGNDNLRPDRLVWHLMHQHNLNGDYSITKLQAYVNDIDADEFLRNAEKSK